MRPPGWRLWGTEGAVFGKRFSSPIRCRTHEYPLLFRRRTSPCVLAAAAAAKLAQAGSVFAAAAASGAAAAAGEGDAGGTGDEEGRGGSDSGTTCSARPGETAGACHRRSGAATGGQEERMQHARSRMEWAAAHVKGWGRWWENGLGMRAGEGGDGGWPAQVPPPPRRRWLGLRATLFSAHLHHAESRRLLAETRLRGAGPILARGGGRRRRYGTPCRCLLQLHS